VTKNKGPRRDIGRLDQIDGLRAVAILWVALYHYAVFWAPSGKGLNLLPYGDALAHLPLANVGFLGVHLFFIVSGFVITFSLERSKGMSHFSLLRAIRLWPALLICGTITFLLTTSLGPASLVRSPLEYLLSLTFVPPAHIGRLLGQPGLEWLDGAYWSLWTEVRFYIIAASMFFLARSRFQPPSWSRFLVIWTGFAIASAFIHLWGMAFGGASNALSRLLFAQYQPYFSAGIALAILRTGKERTGAMGLLVFTVLQAFAYPLLQAGSLLIAEWVGLSIVFLLAIVATQARRSLPILSWRAVVVVGQASYAYYLLHQNSGLALLAGFANDTDLSPIVLMIAIQILLLVGAMLLTFYVETPLRLTLRRTASLRSRFAEKL